VLMMPDWRENTHTGRSWTKWHDDGMVGTIVRREEHDFLWFLWNTPGGNDPTGEAQTLEDAMRAADAAHDRIERKGKEMVLA
jgi:hypothetical protein